MDFLGGKAPVRMSSGGSHGSFSGFRPEMEAAWHRQREKVSSQTVPIKASGILAAGMACRVVPD